MTFPKGGIMDHEFYRELLNSLADGVYFVDVDRTVTFWNKASERISGFSAQEVIGKSCADNVLRHVDADGNHLCVEGCPLSKTMEDGKIRENEVYLHHKLGHRVPVAVRASPMLDKNGRVIGAVEIFSNNSKSLDVLTEIEALRKEVLRDGLTEIGNRRFAEMTLQNYEESLLEHGVPFAVLFVDIDHFKHVNDTWGHDMGDRVLQMVARTLANALRVLDVACRWGGEEFVVLLPNVTGPTALEVAERLRMLVENSWIEHQGELIKVTVSLGCAVSVPGENAASVVNRADKQMYRSKNGGRNCVHLDGV